MLSCNYSILIKNVKDESLSEVKYDYHLLYDLFYKNKLFNKMKHNLLKHLGLIFLFHSIFFVMQAQNTEQEKRFLRTYIEEQAPKLMGTDKGNIRMQFDEVPYYIHIDATDHIRTISFKILAHEDINDDGVDDYVLVYDVEGMQEGQQYVQGMLSMILMKDEMEVEKRHNIITEQLCSWYKIDHVRYLDKRIKATVTQSTCPNRPPVEKPEKTEITFAFDGNRCYEETYRSKCKMAQMTNKEIFKSEVAGNLVRQSGIHAETYMDVENEIYTEDGLEIKATLQGCDNLYLNFFIDITYPSQERLLDIESKNIILEKMTFLINNTRYKTILSKVKDDYEKQAYSNHASRKGAFDPAWKYIISQITHKKEEQKLSFYIVIYNEENLNEVNMWDMLMRRK